MSCLQASTLVIQVLLFVICFYQSHLSTSLSHVVLLKYCSHFRQCLNPITWRWTGFLSTLVQTVLTRKETDWCDCVACLSAVAKRRLYSSSRVCPAVATEHDWLLSFCLLREGHAWFNTLRCIFDHLHVLTLWFLSLMLRMPAVDLDKKVHVINQDNWNVIGCLIRLVEPSNQFQCNKMSVCMVYYDCYEYVCFVKHEK